MYSRLLEPLPKRSFFLFGPRGVGNAAKPDLTNSYEHVSVSDIEKMKT